MSAIGSILTNSGALDALQGISASTQSNNMLESELSSGLSINSPADNPAGYITAQGFTSQLNGITQAISNANEGVSLMQTAQGAISQQIGIAQSLNSIAVQAANGTQTTQESSSLQSVASQLIGQISTIATQTQFNNVNLLDGSFQNVQFQVGANEGQTMNLSISNTASSALGMYQTAAVASTLTTGGTGAFTPASAVTIAVGGSAIGSVSPTNATESAAGLASQINAMAGAKGVTASASNVFDAGALSGAGTLTMTLAASGSGNVIGNKYQASGSSLTKLVASINKGTSNTGISASVNSSSHLILTQANAQNIQVTGFAATGSAALANITANSVIQGGVQVAAAQEVTVGGAAADGISATSNFVSLADVNVSTVNGTPTTPATLNAQGGANQAINVVKYALDSLNNTGGDLGAVQQGLTANINNLNTTSQNVTTALGTVQDANIPQVSNKLTEAEIQSQAGVAALKASTQIQQSYTSLLP